MSTQSDSVADKAKWKFLGQLFGALGVIASLVFVAWEIRQNTEAVKSATIQALSEQSVTVTALFVQNDELIETAISLRNEEELTRQEQVRIQTFYRAVLRVQKNRFLQIELGILDVDTAVFMGARSPMYSAPYFVEWWEEEKKDEPEAFVEYFETHVMQIGEPAE